MKLHHLLANRTNMISAAQLRAARALLDWTRSDLAKAANISPETIKNIEHGTFRPQEVTAEAITRTFAAHGVEFTENEGVRLIKDSIIRYAGAEGFKRFADSVYQIALLPCSRTDGDKPVCASNFNDDLFAHHLGDYLSFHVERMNQIPNFKVKILAQNNSARLQNLKARGSKYRECRQPVGENTGQVPFYVYGDNLGILILDGTSVEIIIISSAPVAKAYREQFNLLWQHAKPINEV